MGFINNKYLIIWVFNLTSLCFFVFTLKASSNIKPNEDDQDVKPPISSAPHSDNQAQAALLPAELSEPWPSREYINQCIRRKQRVVISRQLTDAELKEKGVHLCYQKSKFIYVFLMPQDLPEYLDKHPDSEFIM